MIGSKKRGRLPNFLDSTVLDDSLGREMSSRTFTDLFNDDNTHPLERVQSSSFSSRLRSRKNVNAKLLSIDIYPIPSSIVSKTGYDISLRLLDEDGNRCYTPQPISLECSLFKCKSDAPMDQESSYKEVRGPNVLEILGSHSLSFSSSRPQCVIERDGVCKFQLVVNKATSNDEQYLLGFSPIIEDMPVEFNIEPAYSNRFTVSDFGLEIVHPLPEVWYKDQGGRENSLDLIVKLVTFKHTQVTDVSVPLKLVLLYGNGDSQMVPDQSLLKLFSESKPSIDKSTGEAHMRVRIEDVSKNHQSRPFTIKIEPDYSRPIHGSIGSLSYNDIGYVVTNDVHVRSKPTKSSMIRESGGRGISMIRSSYGSASSDSARRNLKKPKVTAKKSKAKAIESDSEEYDMSDEYDEYDSRKRKQMKTANTAAPAVSMITPKGAPISSQAWQIELFSQIQMIRGDIDKLLKQHDKLLNVIQESIQPTQSPLLSHQQGPMLSSNPSAPGNIDHGIFEGLPEQGNLLNGSPLPDMSARQVSLGRLYSGLDPKRARAIGENSLAQLARIVDAIPIRQSSLLEMDLRGLQSLTQASSQTDSESANYSSSEPLDANVQYILMLKVPYSLLYKFKSQSDSPVSSGSSKFFLAGYDQGKRLVGFYSYTSGTPSFSVISEFNPESIKEYESKYQDEIGNDEKYMQASKSYKSGANLAKVFFTNGFPPPFETN